MVGGRWRVGRLEVCGVVGRVRAPFADGGFVDRRLEVQLEVTMEKCES